MSTYPTQIDTFSPGGAGELMDGSDSGGHQHVSEHAKLADAVRNIQLELGLSPSGSLTDLKAFLSIAHNDDGTLKATPSAGNPSGVQTVLQTQAVAGVATITTRDVLDVAVGMIVGVGALLNKCEVRRIGAISPDGKTLTLSSPSSQATPLNVTHSAGERVWVAYGAVVPLEWFGCVAASTLTDSFQGLKQALIDAGEQNAYVLQGKGRYISSRPLPINDGTPFEYLTITAATGGPFAAGSGGNGVNWAIDARVGCVGPGSFDGTVAPLQVGTDPAQHLLYLAGQMGTIVAVDVANDTVKLSAGTVGPNGDRIVFYARPGSTLPGGLEEGRCYFVQEGGDTDTVKVCVDQWSATPVNITDAGTGSFVYFSPGLARLNGYGLSLEGGNVPGLNGLHCLLQQPDLLLRYRGSNFPGPRGALYIGPCQEGRFDQVEVTDSTVGYYNDGGQFVYIDDLNSEHNDTNFKMLGGQQIALNGGHLETAGVATVSRKQRVIGQAAVTGGTFTISFRGSTTAPIAWNASAATVQAALEALPLIDPGDVTVTAESGTWDNNTTYQKKYLLDFNTPTGQYRWRHLRDLGALITVSSAGLTGGTYTAATDLAYSEARNISHTSGRGVACRDFATNSGPDFYTRENVPGSDQLTGVLLENISSTGQDGNAVNDLVTGFKIPWADGVDGGCAEQLDYYCRGSQHASTKHEGWWLAGLGGASVSFESFLKELRLRSVKLRLGAIGSATGPTITTGTGAPTADEPISSIYLRQDGGVSTSLYVKTAAGAGAGNWTAK